MRTPWQLCVLFLIATLAGCDSEPYEPGPDDDDVVLADYAVTGPDGTVKVLICHVQSNEARELEVAFEAVRSHLSHGDFLGLCAPPN